MRAEVWALLGVVIGAVLTGAIQLIQSALQRRWAEQDAETVRTREHESRIFDHRRIAYGDFVDQFRKDYDASFAWVYHLPDGAPPDYDAYDALGAAAERVGIFGTERAYEIAHEAVNTMAAYGNEGLQHEADVERLIGEFRKVARADLGIDSAGQAR
ncbi:hypothetical protein [Promicromonospora sukumoe]|uniref:hypothetical protein n=1 Tax=Promicromonospora sukumoe TaxID=88382 RepID=UPI003663F39A